jgi:probable phosphoglycerate mutase
MSLRLFIMRHGETEWTLSGQHSGRAAISLTENGKAEAKAMGERIRDIEFSTILVSPLHRARQTCEWAGLSEHAKFDEDLAEWDNGGYEGRTTEEILAENPGWNLYHDGCPGGEQPMQVSQRVDRFIDSLKKLDGDIAIVSHGHLIRVLAARWLGLSVSFGQHLLLDTASISILCLEHDRWDQPAILLWNSSNRFNGHRRLPPSSDTQSEATTNKQRSLERWENEGGDVLVASNSVAPNQFNATRMP